MAFPATKLPLVTELLINGAWTDVTSRRRIAGGLEITRGRGDWSSRAVASRGDCVFENADAYFSNRRADSPNFGLLGRNTQLRHRIRWVQDTFTRSVSSGWGTADSLQAWSIVTGTAADFSASGTTGQIALPTANVDHIIKLPVGHADMTVYASGVGTTTGTVPVGNDVFWAMYGRYQGTNDFIGAELTYHTSDAVELKLYQFLGGGFTSIGSVVLGALGSVSAWDVELRIRGSRVAARAWVTGTAQPDWMLTGTTTLTGTGDFAVSSKRFAGNTTAITYLASLIEVSDYRFWGETSAFAPVWKPKGATGVDVTTPVQAAGVLQRLGTRPKALRSAHSRAVLAATTRPTGYWPLEDSDRAVVGASPISGCPSMAPRTTVLYTLPAGTPIPPGGGPKFGAGVGPAGSGKLADFTDGGQLVVDVPAAADGSWSLEWVANWQPDATGTKVMMTMLTSGTYNFFQFDIGSSDIFVTHASDGTGASSDGSASFPFNRALGTPHHFRYAVTQSGANYDARLYLDGTLVDTADNFGSPMVGTVGHITQISINPQSDSGTGLPSAFGQLTVWTTQTPSVDTVSPAFAWAGETAAARLDRLCDESGLPFELVGTAADTALMGPQGQDTLINLLFECAEADQGVLYEPRDALGLGYRTRVSLYNQTGLALDYTAGQIKPPFLPVEDDQLVENDITGARKGNEPSAHIEVTTGPLSTQAPPNGVGTYDADPEWNVYTDSQVEPLVAWRAHLGTWDEPRFPTVTVNLAAPAVAASASLTASVAALDLGDYLSVANPPPWLAPEAVELLAQGSREFHGDGTEWQITWNTVPAGPWKVFELDSATLCRLEGDHALNSSVTTTGTSWSVKTLSGPVLVDTDSEDGMQWMVEGELVTVTDISGTSSPQTCTVTRSVNGIVKAHAANVPVALFPAPYLAL